MLLATLRRALVSLLATPVLLDAQSGDSARGPLFTRRDAAVIALFSAASVATTRFDTRIYRRVSQPDIQGRGLFRNTSNAFNLVNEKSLFLAAVAGYGISRAAAGTGAPATDISAHVAEAVLISTVFNTGIRGLLGRSRPLVTKGDDPYDFNPGKGFSNFDYRAFPSVHASSSFATAAVITAETRRRAPRAAPWVGTAAYTLAALPGLSRVYRGKHWASDVVMGAFVGTLTGLKVVGHEHGPGSTWVGRHLLGR